MPGKLYFFLKRLRLSIIFLFKGIEGLSRELGRDVKKHSQHPAQAEFTIRAMSQYIYVTALSEALGVPPEVIIANMAAQAEVLAKQLERVNEKGREEMYM